MNDMINLKDRTKLGVSPSTEVIEMDCRYLANIVGYKTTHTVIVPEEYLRTIERASHILEILQGDAINDRLLEISIQEATDEYELELEDE
jgi:hypothetical protein